ncbi:MAG: hypothetical protein COA58_06605 [Bacteroidetes bacterium]|nr:MAG: hypothetical protein COA58_06605 [Bacteroidota bacterium]
MKRSIVLGAFFVLFLTDTIAQFNTPTIDGAVSSGEYGTHTDGSNQNTNGSTVWYCTWDNTNIYFAVSGGFNSSSDAICVYLDANPSAIVNSGTGLTSGTGYDGVTPDLPFSSDAFIYVKSGYKDRNIVSTGSWSSNGGASSNISDWVNTSVVEFSIPWSSLGVSSRPSQFNWLGFVSYSSGCFAHVPTANPGGTSPEMVRYYTIDNTNNSTAVKPFSQESYTHIGSNITSFGAISIYDFTMNTSSSTITRSTGTWDIDGDLIINNGTIDFGSNDVSTSVDSSIIVETSGALVLSSYGSSVDVSGDLENNGTFTANGAEIVLNGSLGQAIKGNFSSISGATNNLSSLQINNSTGVSLETNVFLRKPNSTSETLTLTDGILDLNGYTLELDTGITVGGSFSSSSMINATSGNIRWRLNKTGTYMAPIGGASVYSPLQITFNSGTFASGAYIDIDVTEAKHPSNSSSTDYISRYWDLDQSSISSFSADILMNYSSGDVSGTESQIYAAKLTSGTWSISSANSTSGQLTFSGATSFSSFTGGAVGSLPVNLIDFRASIAYGGININWQTALELNCSHYNLFKRIKGVDVFLESIDGHGTVNSISEYSALDKEVLQDNVYFIHQVDTDGEVEVFGPVSIRSQKVANRNMKLVGRVVHINSINPASLRITNVSGQVLVEEKLKVNEIDFEIPSFINNQIVFIEALYPNNIEVLKVHVR